GSLVRGCPRRVRLSRGPAIRGPIFLHRGADPGAHPVDRRDWAQYPHRLLRPALARLRRLHGGRALPPPHTPPPPPPHHPPSLPLLGRRLPQSNILVVFLFAGVMAMLVGLLFGLPSLRIKGFYLAVATLASQFFLEWAFARVKWFTNYAPSGSVAVGRIELF